MKITGFSFIRNAVDNDYPIVEAITSILPICDEFIVAHGDSSDDTLGLLQAIGSSKIKIIQTTWNESLREGGRVFAQETDRALSAISPDTDWAFYIQGDECVHEKYLPTIRKAMEDNLHDDRVEGLLFKYLHFYGSYDFIASSRRWYRREIRAIKYKTGVQSYRDAQGFRIDGRKIRVALADAYIYHYGWVKPPKGLASKVKNFNKFYQSEEWINRNLPDNYEFDYSNAHRLEKFSGTHPAVIKARIKVSNWKFSFDPVKLQRKMSLRYRILDKIEQITGWRIGEYKNYTLLR